jgi:hypothetical protein
MSADARIELLEGGEPGMEEGSRLQTLVLAAILGRAWAWGLTARRRGPWNPLASLRSPSLSPPRMWELETRALLLPGGESPLYAQRAKSTRPSDAIDHLQTWPTHPLPIWGVKPARELLANSANATAKRD